jgi:signal transduction histidine kinase
MKLPLRLNQVLRSKGLQNGARLALACAVASQLSAIFYSAPSAIPIHAGVALAGLVMGGISLWPAILLGMAVTQLANVSSVFLALGFAVANTTQAVVGAYLLKRIHFDRTMIRMRDIFTIVLVAFVASTVVPTLGTLVYYISAQLGGFGGAMSWSHWWAGHILSLLVVTPLLIMWLPKSELSSKRVVFEGLLAFLALTLVSLMLFVFDVTSFHGVSLVYLLMVPLFWVALRFGMRSITLALLLTSVITLWGVSQDTLREGQILGNVLVTVEIFLDVIAVMFFIVTAISEERKRSAEALERHIDRLREALDQIHTQDQAKSNFIAVLAHELRNPLTPIVASIDLLKRKVANDEGAMKLVGLMDSRAQMIRRLLEDLLDVSRISQDKLKLKKEAVDLNESVKQSVLMVKNQIQTRGQCIETQLSNKAITINADPVRIEQVVTNLLTNASKFTDQGGLITVTLKADNATAVLKVCDTGRGIDFRMIDRIFEPFLQIESSKQAGGGLGFSSKPSNDGLGIGLSLVKRLVDMHQGSIEVKSEGLGKGSEFTVRLPLFTPMSLLPSRLETESEGKEVSAHG